MPENDSVSQMPYLTYEQMNLINDFRFLMLELAMWGRTLMISMKNNLGDVNAVYDRLLKVPLDFYETMSTFYGKQAAEQFLNLITQHLIIFRDLGAALMSDDRQAADESLIKWYQNADDIATFFARLNPYWNREHWRNLLYQYMQIIYYHVVDIVSGNYAGEIEKYDRILYHTTLLADYLSLGLLQHLSSVPQTISPITPPTGTQPAETQPTETQPTAPPTATQPVAPPSTAQPIAPPSTAQPIAPPIHTAPTTPPTTSPTKHWQYK